MQEPGTNPTDSHQIETWTVYRVDDRGNQFTVRTGLTQAEAESLVKEFESRGHKQMYWAERIEHLPQE